MLDLEFIVMNVPSWPQSATTVRLDSDGEIAFDDSSHDFYPDDILAAKAVFEAGTECKQCGTTYTRQDWEQIRARYND